MSRIPRIIFGCGYLGYRAAKLWQASGDHVVAVTRREERARELGGAGMVAAQGDVANPESLRFLASPPALGGAPPESLLFAVGYDRHSAADIHAVYAGGLRSVLAVLPPSVTRIVYISTTGVYGPHDGEWVDELTPPDPQRDGGRASLAAEQVLTDHQLGRRSVILRMAGLYGPGRVPHLDKLRAGEPLPVPRDGWLNLIHVDDAARIVVAADGWLATRTSSGDVVADGPHIFCVTDGAPVRRDHYYREAARRLGAPPPQFAAPPPNSPVAARAGANRRVRNQKMRETFGLALDFPTYREGLARILTAR